MKGRAYLKALVKSHAAQDRSLRIAEGRQKTWMRTCAAGDDLDGRNEPSDRTVEAYHDYHCIHDQRVNTVRKAALAAQIAYAYVRGRPFASGFDNIKNRPDWFAVAVILIRATGTTSATIFNDLRAWYARSNLPAELGP